MSSHTSHRTITCSSCGHTGPNAGRGWCRACYASWLRAGKPEDGPVRHDGHDVITRGNGYPFCLTCFRGDADVDEIAVVRAVGGDAPGRLLIAEREAAIVRLRAWGLTYDLIGQRVGCHLQTAHETCKRLGVTDIAGARALAEERQIAA